MNTVIYWYALKALYQMYILKVAGGMAIAGICLIVKGIYED